MKLKAKEIALIAVPIAIGIYFIIRQVGKNKLNDFPEPTPPSPPNPNQVPSPISYPRSEFPLKKGSDGSNVTRLQTALKNLNPSALPVYGIDGDFGKETETALVNQTGKKTCSEAELLVLEVKGLRAVGERTASNSAWHPPMVSPGTNYISPTITYSSDIWALGGGGVL